MFHQSQQLVVTPQKIKTGDKIKIDLNKSRVDLLISAAEFKKRRKKKKLSRNRTAKLLGKKFLEILLVSWMMGLVKNIPLE